MSRKKLYIILFIFLIIFIILYFVGFNKKVTLNIQNKIISVKPFLTLNQVRNQYNNQDIKGHIKIDGTNVDGYFAKANDNAFYLTHDLNKNYSVFGSIFIDYRNDINDKQINLYGHNGNHVHSPFYELSKFKDQFFYKNNNKIYLYSDKGTYKVYQIFAVSIVSTNEHMNIKYQTEKQWSNHLKYFKDHSLYDTNVEVTNEDSILILQTCTYEKENSFLLICAKQIK